MQNNRVNRKLENNLYITFIAMFFILNLAQQYFLIYKPFNTYSELFILPIWTHFVALIGNFIMLLMIYTIAKLVTPRRVYTMLYLLIMTILFSVIAWVLSMYFKYYHQFPDIYDLAVTKNDGGNLNVVLFYTSFLELFTHARIIYFISSIVLITLFIIYVKRFRKVRQQQKTNKPRMASLLILSVLISFGFNYQSKKIINDKWPLHHQKDTFRSQTTGVFTHFFYQIMEIDVGLHKDKKVSINIEDYIDFDKNVTNYTNIFGETYSSNELLLSDASTVSLDPSIYQNDLFGLFEDKNIIFFQLESFNKYLLENPILIEYNIFENLNKLLSESYYFENFHSNVGVAHTSDAELSVLTGLLPDGKSTAFWDFDDFHYSLNTIPKIINDNYHTETFHGDNKYFYNRNVVYKDMIMFDKYFSFDVGEPYFDGTTNGVWMFPDYLDKPTPDSPWLSEYDLLQWIRIRAELHLDNEEKFFFFPITVHPHTPYYFNPYEDSPMFTKDDFKVDSTTLRMLNYLKYYDEFFGDFMEFSKQLKDTVYIFHADHGTLISNKDTKTLMAKENPTDLEVWQETNKTMAFIYAPDDNDTTNFPSRGLIKGVQPKVRSQIDLYRTILELMGQNNPTDLYFGVNALSDETTFAIHAKNLTLVTDNFYMNLKNYIFSGDQSSKTIYHINPTSKQELDFISEFALRQKAFNDALLLKNKFKAIYQLKLQNLN